MELRKDYILDRWVIIASGRKKRPHEFKKEEVNEKKGVCFFCPDNEDLTPPEIGRREQNGKWFIRWFPNKFPAVEYKGDPEVKTDNEFFTFSSAFGNHEVVVETPSHEKQLWDLPADTIKEVLYVYNERINKLNEDEKIKYVIVFKNHGRNAGTSLVHSHTQIVGMNVVPSLVREEVEASKKKGSCPYCKIIEIEKESNRRCFENDGFVAFAPYASRFNFEIWIFPKKHAKNLNEFDGKEMYELADILRRTLRKLKELNASYNFFLHYAPEGEDLHFHIRVMPRFSTWAGFEFASDIIINSVSPEDAAEFYRK